MSCAEIARLTGLLWALLSFGLSAGERTPEAFSQTHTTPALSVEVDLVLLNTIVTDPRNRNVSGLGKENFQVWEDRIEQEILYFSSEEVPLSVGIIFDISQSMQDKLTVARNAANTFLNMGEKHDEYFLVEFSNSPQLTTDFTNDISKIQNRLLLAQANGMTSLYDALYLGLEKVGHGNNPRKALLLITDGEDNHSKHSFSELKEFAKEHDVQIYAIGIVDEGGIQGAAYNSRGRLLLEDIANLTGGRAFFPPSAHHLEKICAEVALDLKNQYVLGYRPSNRLNNGEWRKIKIKINRPKGTSSLRVHAKTGYYASSIAKVSK